MASEMADRFLDQNKYNHKDAKGKIEGSDWSKKLFTSYWAYGDSFFARGYVGLIYSLWLIAIGVIALLQVTLVYTDRFVITLALVCTELCVTALGTGVLAFFVYWAQKSVNRLRRHGNDGHTGVHLVTIANMVRSRYNADNDFNLLSAGLVWSLIETTIVCVLATGVRVGGTNPITHLSNAGDLEVENGPLPVNGSDALFNTANLVFVAQLVILVKVAVQLGRALNRTSAVVVNEKLNQIYALADASAKMELTAVTSPVERTRLAASDKNQVALYI